MIMIFNVCFHVLVGINSKKVPTIIISIIVIKTNIEIMIFPSICIPTNQLLNHMSIYLL